MDIYINEKQVDFQLETEKNVYDILENIERWGGENNLIILNYKLNQGELLFLIDRQENKQSLIADIDRIDVCMVSNEEYVFKSTKELKTFCEKFKSNVYKVEIDEAITALEWIEDNLKSLLDIFKLINKDFFLEVVKDIKISLYKPAKNKNILDEQLNKLEELTHRLVFKAWVSHLSFNLKVATKESSFKVRDEIITLSDELIDKIPPIAENIQTGRDGEAMHAIEDLTEAYQVLMMYAEKTQILAKTIADKANKTGKNLFEDIKNILKEIEEHLDKEDMVQVSDLIEYEFGEKLRDLKQLIEVSQ